MRLPNMNAGARAYLDRLAAANATPIYKLTPAEARASHDRRQADLMLPPLSICGTEDLLIDDRVPVRLYRPHGKQKAPVLVYLHGGGWTLGGLHSVDAICHDVCHLSGWAVLSVDYRLAPEHPFPAPLDDGRFVLERVLAGDVADGLDYTCVSVAGDSAGGTLAAVLALEYAQALTCQVLVYPVTDRARTVPEMDRFGTALNLDFAAMNWFWENYAPDPDMHEDWRVSPLCADEQLSAAPPALVVLAGYDPLYDEGRDYADKLAQSGCETELLVFPDQIHGFANQTALSTSPYALRDAVAGFLRRRAPETAT